MNDIFLNPEFHPKKKSKRRKNNNNKPFKKRKLSKKEESETPELPRLASNDLPPLEPSIISQKVSSLTPQPKKFEDAVYNPDYLELGLNNLRTYIDEYQHFNDKYSDNELSNICKNFIKNDINIPSKIVDLYTNKKYKNNINEFKMINDITFFQFNNNNIIYKMKNDQKMVSQICFCCIKKLIFLPVKEINNNEYIGITICKNFPLCMFPICRINYIDKWVFIIKKSEKKKRYKQISNYQKKRNELNEFNEQKCLEIENEAKNKKKEDERKRKELRELRESKKKNIWDGFELCNNPYGFDENILKHKMKQFVKLTDNEIMEMNRKYYGVVG